MTDTLTLSSDQEQNNDTQNLLDQLVGEGKKYKDVNALAKAVIDKDQFIEQLQNENAEARGELKARLSIEELLEKRNKPTPGGEPREPTPTEPVSENAEIDFDALFEKHLAKKTRQENLNLAKQELTKRFGENYQPALDKIAQDLGVSKRWLDDIAMQSPSGFNRLLDSLKAPDGKPYTPPQSSGGVAPQAPTGKKNYAYYQELRKTDPKRYFSKAVQQEIHKEATTQGPAFFE